MRARDNPFRTERVLRVRYQFVDDTGWDRLLERLEQSAYRGAIVGPEGTGKTTLQEGLADRLEAAGRTVCWLRFHRGIRNSAAQQIAKLRRENSRDDLLFVDGAEQLSWILWLRLRRLSNRYAGLVINSHQPGRLPTLVRCRTTPALLARIVNQLTPHGIEPPADELGNLFRRFNGNLRLCLRELYDRCAGS